MEIHENTTESPIEKKSRKRVVKKKSINRKKKKVKSKKKKRPLNPNIKLFNGDYYRIIVTSQKKLYTDVYSTYVKNKALEAYEKILEHNSKNVKFPIRYSSRDHKLVPAKYELILMRRKRSESGETLLRNEIGQLIPHLTNSKKTEIFKKDEYLIEETFWVYGLNPKSQRKEYSYILNDILLNGLMKVNYPMKNVVIFLNKLIIQTDDDFDMVICKCKEDAARLYIELQKDIKALKYKSVFFAGLTRGVLRKRMVQLIQEKTGWSLTKINRRTTRP